MAIDIFSLRYMLGVVTQIKRPKRFFLDTFFSAAKSFDTETVDIDVWKGKRRMAPFCSPLVEGKVMDRLGFSTHPFKPAYVKPKRPTKAGDLLTRQPGQVVYPGNQSMQDRAAVLLAGDMLDLMDAIVRREEWMAAQALTTGAVPVIGEGVNMSVDFLMAADHKIDLTIEGKIPWDDPDSDPIADLTAWSLKVLQDSGKAPDRVIMGTDAWAKFINHPKIKGKDGIFNNLKINVGQINPQMLEDGIAYCATITSGLLNVDIYVYVDWYVDDQDNDTEKQLLPANLIVMGSTRAQNTRLYGAIQDMDAVEELGGSLIATPVFAKSWVQKDPSLRWLLVQSAPLPALNQPDAFLFAKVLA